MKKIKHFLSVADLSAKEIWQILKVAKKLKAKAKKDTQNSYKLSLSGEKLTALADSNPLYQPLRGKSLVMLFEKPSLRTKLSFDLAFTQLGGHSIYFGPNEVGLGKREAVSDVGKVVSSMADLIVARVFSHKSLEKLAQNSKVPVINALSDLEHPCQILTDFLTILEIKGLPAGRQGKLKGLTLAYVGDGRNNVANSLSLGCKILGIRFKCASPKGYGGTQISPEEAVKDADIVYTDTWVSMGDEGEEEKRLIFFKPYQVDKKLFNLAKKDSIFMHPLPAHRGREVTSEVIDGGKSVVFEQAENRLYLQKALLLYLL